jgi:hypothetical protein
LEKKKKVKNKRTGVRNGIKQWQLRRVRIHWPRQRVRIALLLQHGHQTRHEKPRQYESGGHAAVANVLLNLCLAVKMRHVGQSALGDLRHVEQRREDQVVHAGGLAGVRHDFSLADFDVLVGRFPEVGNEKDGVGAGDGLGDGVRGGEIGLERQSAHPEKRKAREKI